MDHPSLHTSNIIIIIIIDETIIINIIIIINDIINHIYPDGARRGGDKEYEQKKQ
jgi:hypothetical protein